MTKNEMTNYRVDLVNNTSCDLRMFSAAIIAGVKDGSGLPEELADLFTLEIISNDDGTPRGILRAA